MTARPLVALALFVALQGGFGLYVAFGGRPTPGEPSVDFATYYIAGVATARGESAYALSDAAMSAIARDAGITAFAPPYRYPPLISGLLAHLAWLPFRAALVAWTIASLAALLGAGLALSRSIGGRSIDPRVFLGLAAFVPAANALYTGQADTFVLLAVALLLASPARLGGAALGLSLVVKPLAAPVAALVALRVDKPRLVWTAVGLVGGALAATVLAGPAAMLEYAANALRLSTVANLGLEAQANNVSLFGAFARLFSAAPDAARVLAATAAVVVVGITVAVARGAPFGLSISLAAVATLLAVPVAWYHDATIAFVAFIVLWPPSRPRWRAVLAVAFVLLGAHGVAWRAVASFAPQLPVATVGLLLLFAACVSARRGVGAS